MYRSVLTLTERGSLVIVEGIIYALVCPANPHHSHLCLAQVTAADTASTSSSRLLGTPLARLSNPPSQGVRLDGVFVGTQDGSRSFALFDIVDQVGDFREEGVVRVVS